MTIHITNGYTSWSQKVTLSHNSRNSMCLSETSTIEHLELYTLIVGRVPIKGIYHIPRGARYTTWTHSTKHTSEKWSCWMCEPNNCRGSLSDATWCRYVIQLLGICSSNCSTHLKPSPISCYIKHFPTWTFDRIKTWPFLPPHLWMPCLCSYNDTSNKIWSNIPKTSVCRVWQFYKGV